MTPLQLRIRNKVRSWFGLPAWAPPGSKVDRDRRRQARLDADARRWARFERDELERQQEQYLTEAEITRARLERDRVIW